ncbi:MAG: hypothetical protein FWD88_07425 [Treponema sp.]|nr:hypothetical protein [Treponema sp.]
MKKLFALVAVACVAAPLFALPDIAFSAGGGGIFSTHWHTGTLAREFRDYHGLEIMPGVMGPTLQTQSAMRQGLFCTRDFAAGGGVFGFFDATVATVGVGLVFNRVHRLLDIPELSDSVSPSLAGQEALNFTVAQLNLSLMLRYPITMAETLTVFPMLGIDGQIALNDFGGDLRSRFQRAANHGYRVPTPAEFWNSLWIRFGAGTDFSLGGDLFLRGEMLYGFKLNSSHESGTSRYREPGLGANGIQVRLSAGYTFRRLGGTGPDPGGVGNR